MKKIVCFGLCFLIVLCSFALCFADSYSPVLLPKSSVLFDSVKNSPYYIFSSNTEYRYSASHSDVYFALIDSSTSGGKQWVAMSKEPNRFLYQATLSSGTVASVSLSYYLNGYYYNGANFVTLDTNVPYFPDVSLSDFVTQFFRDNSVILDLTPIVVGSVSWLSAVVDGVLQAPMLLFLILSSFIGIAVGLLFRFRRG